MGLASSRSEPDPAASAAYSSHSVGGKIRAVECFCVVDVVIKIELRMSSKESSSLVTSQGRSWGGREQTANKLIRIGHVEAFHIS